MKKCPKCHKNIPSNAKVCPYCGTPQSGYQPMKRTPKRKYAFIYPILIIALVFLPMGISYFFAFNALSDSGINQTATLKTYTKSNQETVVYQYDSLKEFSKNVKNSKKYVNKINNMESSLEKIVGTKNMDSEYLFQITDNNNLHVSVQYDISLDKQYIMVYNLLLFINRNQFNVVYIDFPITQTTLKWLKSFDQDNILFLLNNDYMACDSIEELEKFAMLIVSNKDYIEKYEYDLNQFNNISYIQNPYTMLHKQQQTEKNIRLMEQFEDKSTTFYLTFNDTYAQDVL